MWISMIFALVSLYFYINERDERRDWEKLFGFSLSAGVLEIFLLLCFIVNMLSAIGKLGG